MKISLLVKLCGRLIKAFPEQCPMHGFQELLTTYHATYQAGCDGGMEVFFSPPPPLTPPPPPAPERPTGQFWTVDIKHCKIPKCRRLGKFEFCSELVHSVQN